jgi:hypothetical protein
VGWTVETTKFNSNRISINTKALLYQAYYMAWNGLAAASQPVGACSIMVPVQPKPGVTPLARINVPQPKMSACAHVTATKDVCLVR